MIIAFERFNQLFKQDGTPTDRLGEFFEELSRQVNLNTVMTGTGSPEGVVTAQPTQLYMDTAGVSGTILYIKKTGTGNTGWILV
jgi:hypothetical protein